MQFTYPFCYVPHPLCQLAAEEVKRVVRENAEWNAEVQEGKMLGVLVVEGGFLAAFSGTLCGKSTLPYFVPPVFDLHGTYFEEEEQRILARKGVREVKNCRTGCSSNIISLMQRANLQRCPTFSLKLCHLQELAIAVRQSCCSMPTSTTLNLWLWASSGWGVPPKER